MIVVLKQLHISKCHWVYSNKYVILFRCILYFHCKARGFASK